MEGSILTDVKKMLGIAEEVTDFDLDVITHINSVFAVLQELGVGPPDVGYAIVDDSDMWDEYIDSNGLNMIRSYLFLRVRMLFDPPSTSFHLDAMNRQIEEFTVRICNWVAWMANPVDPMSA